MEKNKLSKMLMIGEAFEKIKKAKIPYETVLWSMMEQSVMFMHMIDYLVSMGLLEDFFSKHEDIRDKIELLRQAVRKKEEKKCFKEKGA